MKLTVLGIVFLSVGTYFTLTEKGKVLGVALIALGTLLMYLSQRHDSTLDSRRLEAKLTEIRHEITEAKALPAPKAAVRLDQIDRSLSEWASTFVKEKAHRKIEAEQTRLAGLKTQLDGSEIWRPVLEFFLSTVGGAFRAYATEANTTITVYLPKLPDNIYDKAGQYKGSITFRQDVSWEIGIRDIPLSEFPVLWVRLIRHGSRDLLAQVTSNDRGTGFVSLTIHNNLVPNLSGMEGDFPRGNWQEGFRNAIMRLVEAQILSLEGHAV